MQEYIYLVLICPDISIVVCNKSPTIIHFLANSSGNSFFQYDQTRFMAFGRLHFRWPVVHSVFILIVYLLSHDGSISLFQFPEGLQANSGRLHEIRRIIVQLEIQAYETLSSSPACILFRRSDVSVYLDQTHRLSSILKTLSYNME